MGQQLARSSPSYKGLCRFFVVRGQNSIWTRAQLYIRVGSAEHLDRADERHEPGLDRETGLALADLVAEFGEHFAVGLGFDLRIGDARRPKAISAAPQSR